MFSTRDSEELVWVYFFQAEEAIRKCFYDSMSVSQGLNVINSKTHYFYVHDEDKITAQVSTLPFFEKNDEEIRK